MKNTTATLIVVAASVLGPVARAGTDFRAAKTIFQTNVAYDPRLAIAVDGVVVHRHGADFRPALQSWIDNGFLTGRMFFADSDAGNIYWKGKWDGTPRPGDVERDRKGEVVMCAGVRPYMLPTDGWIRYLEEMTDQSLAAGARAILPEEPLAHIFSGYEDGFKALWQERYGRAWQGQHESAEACWMTAQLKNELYIELERRLLARTKRPPHAETAFILPIHAIYSNIAARLVAPLGTSVDMPGVDGYIGQIWTGPVNWALNNYGSSERSFFASAYILYDYFNQLTTGSEKKLWLLIDPVEDDPAHAWSEFAQWYKHCAAAMLLIDDVDAYEIMPWPDRIFLPGYGTGGGTPAPQDYRTTILAVTQVLQEVPKGGTRFFGANPNAPAADDNPRIGVAMADTLMWQRHEYPMLHNVYSLFMPLVRRGLEVSSFVLERAADPGYTGRFDVIVLCYESFKPASAAMNEALADWVRRGGRLLVLGRDGDELDQCGNLWWREAGFDSPLRHLLSLLTAPDTDRAQWTCGDGMVLKDPVSPREFADPAVAEDHYLMRLKQMVEPGILTCPDRSVSSAGLSSSLSRKPNRSRWRAV